LQERVIAFFGDEVSFVPESVILLASGHSPSSLLSGRTFASVEGQQRVEANVKTKIGD
jgi:hypothetical protein